MFKQALIPGFPDGAQRIGEALSIVGKDGWVTYFVGSDNYAAHPQGDDRGRRYALAALMHNGHVKPAELSAAPLLIPHRTLMNWKAQYRSERLQDRLDKARRHLLALPSAVADNARVAGRAADTYVQDHPWQSAALGAAVGAAVGLLVGLLIGRR